MKHARRPRSPKKAEHPPMSLAVVAASRPYSSADASSMMWSWRQQLVSSSSSCGRFDIGPPSAAVDVTDTTFAISEATADDVVEPVRNKNPAKSSVKSVSPSTRLCDDKRAEDNGSVAADHTDDVTCERRFSTPYQRALRHCQKALLSSRPTGLQLAEEAERHVKLQRRRSLMSMYTRPLGLKRIDHNAPIFHENHLMKEARKTSTKDVPPEPPRRSGDEVALKTQQAILLQLLNQPTKAPVTLLPQPSKPVLLHTEEVLPNRPSSSNAMLMTTAAPPLVVPQSSSELSHEVVSLSSGVASSYEHSDNDDDKNDTCCPTLQHKDAVEQVVVVQVDTQTPPVVSSASQTDEVKLVDPAPSCAPVSTSVPLITVHHTKATGNASQSALMNIETIPITFEAARSHEATLSRPFQGDQAVRIRQQEATVISVADATVRRWRSLSQPRPLVTEHGGEDGVIFSSSKWKPSLVQLQHQQRRRSSPPHNESGPQSEPLIVIRPLSQPIPCFSSSDIIKNIDHHAQMYAMCCSIPSSVTPLENECAQTRRRSISPGALLSQAQFMVPEGLLHAAREEYLKEKYFLAWKQRFHEKYSDEFFLTNRLSQCLSKWRNAFARRGDVAAADAYRQHIILRCMQQAVSRLCLKRIAEEHHDRLFSKRCFFIWGRRRRERLVSRRNMERIDEAFVVTSSSSSSRQVEGEGEGTNAERLSDMPSSLARSTKREYEVFDGGPLLLASRGSKIARGMLLIRYWRRWLLFHRSSRHGQELLQLAAKTHRMKALVHCWHAWTGALSDARMRRMCHRLSSSISPPREDGDTESAAKKSKSWKQVLDGTDD